LRPTILSEVLENSLFLVRKQCERQEIEITVAAVDDLPPLSLDADRLKQVFLNLFSNAIDAMPTGGRLHIDIRLQSKNVEVVVSDSGYGIEPAKLGLIFEPFYTSKGGEGTGLGLAISHNIISDHGGTIVVESVVGKGTRLRILLPLPEGA